MKKKFLFITTIAVLSGAFATFFNFKEPKKDLPLVAIANIGPLKDLELSINGIQKELEEQGFIKDKTIRYEIADVAFDQSLIPQMVTNLKNHNPKIMVVISTSIAQFAKGKIRDIPLVFHAITDPQNAGLIKDKNQPDENMTGSSDMQDLNVILSFAKSLFPHSKTVGLLYSTSENNDVVLLNMLRSAALSIGLSVLAIPIEQPRDISIRMQELKGKADFIYVGASAGIHSAMPTVSSEAKKMNIPIFDSEDQSVRDGLALASFGVNYEAVGRNTGKLIAKLLNGSDIKTLAPIYPTLQEHKCFINKNQAEHYKIKIPENAIVTE
ncbi:MAG: ABC transporter substrate-binding protein [Holosporales bacterium]|jgi:putative ABC transport system substrate-binding protein|nr:ABC transporter substrate-binding protein [Holosporales bacterium]